MSIEEITKVLKKKYKISPELAARCYIMPNGDFLALDDFNSHSGVQYYLIDQGVVKDSPELHEGGCPTLEDLGAIRCNLLSEGFIMLSKVKPTQAQYDSLIKLLDEYLPRRGMWRFNQREIMLLTPHQKTDFKFFDAVDNTADDIVRIIKNYYDFGRLSEGFDGVDSWDYQEVARNIITDFENLYTDDIAYCDASIVDDWGVGCDIEVFAYDELDLEIAWLVVRVYGENKDPEDETARTGICFRQIEVNEEYQGKGIAKRLVETCLDNINKNSLVLVHMDFSGGFWYHMKQEFPDYNWDKSLHEDLDKNIIHKFKRELKPNEVLLYHQTSGEKLKKIFLDGFIKADVWAQEDIDTFRYGDFAIGFAIDKDKVHKANDTDRIVYQNVPNKDFVYILGSTGRTEKGKEKFRTEFDLDEELTLDQVEDRVRKDLGTSDSPISGPSYILPDGKFLKIRNADIDITGLGGTSKTGQAMHLDVDGYISKVYPKSWQDFKRLSYILNENCIRVNDGFEQYIVLPEIKPTQAQYDALLKWLDHYYFETQNDILTIFGSYTRWKDQSRYNISEYVPDDFIRIIKQYYSSGILREEKQPLNLKSGSNKLKESQEDYFKNSCIKDRNGNLLPVYHSSYEDFNSFESSGFFWFALDEEYAKGTFGDGKHIYTCYLNITNPFRLDWCGDLDDWFFDEDEDWGNLDLVEDRYEIPVTETVKEIARRLGVDKNVLVDIIINTGDADMNEVYLMTRTDEFRDLVKAKGYDGVIANEGSWRTYGCMYPNQIKRVDNLNPTSSNNINETKLSRKD